MKIYMLVLLLIMIAAVFTFPTEDKMSLESLLANEDKSLKFPPVEEHHRARRIVCDLLNGFGVGHSVCAAYCISRGHKGGYCTTTGTCECRTEQYGQLQDNRSFF